MRTIANKSEDAALNTANIVLGAILFLAPWVAEFGSGNYAAMNAWICGAAIAIVAMLAINQTYDWEEGVTLALGLWTAAAPWVLGFAHVQNAMWTHLAVGLLVAAMAGAELWRLYHAPEARSV
ncbi:SPW repeat protein [Methylobacterium oxalidis]|uniref:SPW repeat-containing integral membrane domain-containing protein n=1 Tax=Methylobacterium oxalidis TaxID=944322 RepID=A0A512IXL3_9HYPH|nr:SPW repeat protein [Methylobacterium oxalidis]GEP02339.1 hypothetical protein MOX02_03770 [Methylobacterium oxalidis]GJE31154.1 hypothetical protein LDDCCGHA_1330 [Methylobacterium oxalidis]GLS67718.1 hypothetical protein GCM10007888_61030 [Methylobacterium oxalidis]